MIFVLTKWVKSRSIVFQQVAVVYGVSSSAISNGIPYPDTLCLSKISQDPPKGKLLEMEADDELFVFGPLKSKISADDYAALCAMMSPHFVAMAGEWTPETTYATALSHTKNIVSVMSIKMPSKYGDAGDVSLLKGRDVRIKNYHIESMRLHGINTLTQVRELTVSDLTEMPDIGDITAERILEAANA